MCGIAGILLKNTDRLVDEDVLSRMRDTMVHRGPDDQGNFLDGSLGLAHRRLSIVGLSTGHQPMHNGTDQLWIVFNGEIYNYPQLKRELEKKGYSFRTQSDTEVILHLYSEYGQECVQHLNGMFAFAIWDKAKNHLFLARDRLGEKPLYFAETADAFVFASEVKALLQYPGMKAEVNADAVYEYFLFRAVVGEPSLFKGVHSLLPGHRMTLTAKGYTTQAYWDHRCLPLDSNISSAQAKERLQELLVDAVKIRLMSEVPLGTLCSGGVDSSLVTAIAARAIGQPVNTFSVGFHEAEFDETNYARMVAQKYGTTHHELKLNNREFTELLPSLIYLNDEPLNFSNSVHIFAISKLAKEFVTVVLTGEGADELFLGYPRYQVPRLAQTLRKISFLMSPLLHMAQALKKDHRLEKLSYYLQGDFQELLLQSSATNRAESANAVVQSGLSRKMQYREQVLASTENMESLLARMSLQDQKTYLVSILNRQDKMSMGASVEARVPFLDPRLVEFANSLPASTRMKGFNTKMLVKQVAEEYLPKEVIYRRKSGFGVPLAQWLRETDGLGGLAKRLIFDTRYENYLNTAELQKTYKEHQSGAKDHGEILWTCLNFLLWKEKFAL